MLKLGDKVTVMVSGPYAKAGVVATYESRSSDGWVWAKRADGFSFCAPAEHFEPYPASFADGETTNEQVKEASEIIHELLMLEQLSYTMGWEHLAVRARQFCLRHEDSEKARLT